MSTRQAPQGEEKQQTPPLGSGVPERRAAWAGHPEGGSFWLTPWEGGLWQRPGGDICCGARKTGAPPPLPANHPSHHCTPTPARRVKTHQPLPVSLCLPQTFVIWGQSLSALAWVSCLASGFVSSPRGLELGAAVLYTILPGSDLPLPRCVQGGGGDHGNAITVFAFI